MLSQILVVQAVEGLRNVPAVNTWFAENGGTHEGVEAAECAEGWGLVTTRPIARGEIVVRTPRQLILTGSPASIAQRLLTEDNAYIQSLPTDLTTPALWDDDDLLAGTHSGKSRAELLQRWWSECEGNWDEFRYAQALVMSRGYNVDDEYAVIPYVDFVNHRDAPSVHLTADKDAMSLVAMEDLQEGVQVYSSYNGGAPMDALKSLMAFGWFPEGSQCCFIDCVEALSTQDDLARAKMTLMDAAVDGGRIVFQGKPVSLQGFRLCAMNDDDLFTVVESCEDSLWYAGKMVSPQNELGALNAAFGLVSRKLQELDAGASRRAIAVQNAPPHQATLAMAVAAGERSGLTTFIDWLDEYRASLPF